MHFKQKYNIKNIKKKYFLYGMIYNYNSKIVPKLVPGQFHGPQSKFQFFWVSQKIM